MRLFISTLITAIGVVVILATSFVAGYEFKKSELCSKSEEYSYDLGKCVEVKNE